MTVLAIVLFQCEKPIDVEPEILLSVEGMLVDATNQPIGNEAIHLSIGFGRAGGILSRDKAPFAETQTDASGKFRILFPKSSHNTYVLQNTDTTRFAQREIVLDDSNFNDYHSNLGIIQLVNRNELVWITLVFEKTENNLDEISEIQWEGKTYNLGQNNSTSEIDIVLYDTFRFQAFKNQTITLRYKLQNRVQEEERTVIRTLDVLDSSIQQSIEY